MSDEIERLRTELDELHRQELQDQADRETRTKRAKSLSARLAELTACGYVVVASEGIHYLTHVSPEAKVQDVYLKHLMLSVISEGDSVRKPRIMIEVVVKETTIMFIELAFGEETVFTVREKTPPNQIWPKEPHKDTKYLVRAFSTKEEAEQSLPEPPLL